MYTIYSIKIYLVSVTIKQYTKPTQFLNISFYYAIGATKLISNEFCNWRVRKLTVYIYT